MTDREHISPEDLGLHATQSLPPEESASIQTHLAVCALCRSELQEIHGDLAMLGLSVEQQPLPAGARQRFFDRIAAAPQPRGQASRLPQTPQIPPIASPDQRRGVGFWSPWVAAVAMAGIAVALGIQNRVLNDQLQDEANLVSNLAGKASRAQQVLEVLTAPIAQRVTLTTGKMPAQPTGRVTYLPDHGGLILQAGNLEPLPENKVYELWIIPADGKPPVPAGLFRPNAAGMANLVLPPIPAGIPAKAFGVTIEKAAGSDTPTAPILLSGTASGS